MNDDSAAPSQELSRRTLRSELLVVLTLSLFASAAYAILQYAYDLTHVIARAPVMVEYFPRTFDPYAFARSILGSLVNVAPVALVAHLMARAGRSMRDFGFDFMRPLHDFAFGFVLMVLTHTIGVGSVLIGKALHIPFRTVFGVNFDAHPSAAILLVIASAATAIVEEVIVNAYLITRLQQLGWKSHTAIFASAVLRGSYHLYQGWGGFAGNLVLGAVAGWIYTRTRRVMPLVIAHFLVDVVAFLADLFFGEHLRWLR